MRYTLSSTIAGLSAEGALAGSNLGALIDSSTDLSTDGLGSVLHEDRSTPGPDGFEWRFTPELSCLRDDGTYRLTLKFREHLGAPERTLFRFVRTESEAS